MTAQTHRYKYTNIDIRHKILFSEKRTELYKYFLINSHHVTYY